MTLPGTIVLRPNEFSQPDYSVIYKDPDERELTVRRIFHTTIAGNTPVWFGRWSFTSARAEPHPHQGPASTLNEAKAAWRKCWDSADVPIHWPPSLRRTA